MAAGAPAIKAAVQFAKAGTTAQKASVVKEIAMGMGLGLICGVAFKSWHWSERRKIEEYYKSLNESK